MDMFTSYGHILRSQNKITDFFMILAWASPFNLGFFLMIETHLGPNTEVQQTHLVRF